MKEQRWIIIDMSLNIVFYVLIVLLSIRLLHKIKLKLNLQTRLGFYLNIVALGLRIMFTVWQYLIRDFGTTIGKQIFVYIVDSIIFVFVLNNFGRVIASWMLINSTHATEFQDVLINQVNMINREISLTLVVFFIITIPLTIINILITVGQTKITWLVILSILYYLFQITVACRLSYMVYKARVSNKMHQISSYIIVWLVCLSSILSITIKNIDIVKSNEGKS